VIVVRFYLGSIDLYLVNFSEFVMFITASSTVLIISFNIFPSFV